jgi:uncharacterized protein (DUF1501 family)
MQQFQSPLSRRRFLARAGALATSAALPNVLFARTGGSARLVVVILRGALDGLAAVPPHGDPDYEELHRELAIPAPSSPDGAFPLDGTFGLHPSLGFLHERYLGGELVVFQAVASPYRDRSHFDGQNVLENGLTQPIGAADGWLNRAMASLPARFAAQRERAVAVSQNVPLILRGNEPVLSKSPLATPGIDEDLVTRLADLYSKDDWFSARLTEGVQGEKFAQEQKLADDTRDSGAATVPRATDPTGQPRAAAQLVGTARMAASLMGSDNGPEVAVIEATGWDTHANQGGSRGVLAQRLAGLDDALRALCDGMGPLWPQTAVLVVTEFGRTASVNGTRGTDHGTGGCAFLAGGAVQGGRVIADWPGLTRKALLDGRDIRPTLDLRSVFKAVLADHIRIEARALTARVFPNSQGAPPLHGLIRA